MDFLEAAMSCNSIGPTAVGRGAKRRCANGMEQGGIDASIVSRVANLEQLITIHDDKLRNIEGFLIDSYLLPLDCKVAVQMTKALEAWKSQRPAKGAHPHGHVKVMLAAAFLDTLVKTEVPNGGLSEELDIQIKQLRSDASGIKALGELEQEVGYCGGRPTKQGGKFLLKVQWSLSSRFQRSAQAQSAMLVSMYNAEKLSGSAPKGTIVREIEGNIVDRPRLGGA